MNEVKRYNVIADKYGDGTVELSDAGSVVFYEDYAALKAERDALAAENANLKHLLSMIAETGNANFGRTTLYTPATDAYVNAVRAEVIKDFCQLVGQYGKVEPYHFNSDFADLYAKINKEIYESILDNPAVYNMESLVDWLESGVNDSRAYADMSIQHANQLHAGEPS